MPEVKNQKSEAESQRPEAKSLKPPIRHFTDLIAWQKAFDLGLRIFKQSKTWPREEQYALIDQVRRSSRSVSANIAEAWGKRRYEAHFVSKLSDADTELLETENWLRFAKEHDYLPANDFDLLHDLMREIGRMLGSIMQNPGPFLLHEAKRNV